MKRGSHLHDERRAGGHVGLLGLQLSVGIVEAVPGGAHHVDHVGVHDREIREAMRGDAQHAEVVVQRRCAVFDLNALFFVIHGDALFSKRWQTADDLMSDWKSNVSGTIYVRRPSVNVFHLVILFHRGLL